MIYRKETMGLYDQFTYGKYAGKLLVDVIQTNASYIRWALANVKGFNISRAAGDTYQREINRQQTKSTWMGSYETKSSPMTKNEVSQAWEKVVDSVGVKPKRHLAIATLLNLI